ncbi:flagellar FliJ family protein [Brevirhabdus sp.]|uniref:flagellar FliJ family protein n=1 Tax=Brevirhabdus sp. TaxID=2004514 RepID=UPI004059417B
MTTDAARRMRAFGTIERIKRLDVERIAQQVAAVRSRHLALSNERRDLLARIAGESHVTGVEGATYLGRYLRSIRAEVERLSSEIAQIEPELRQGEESLRAALADEKTYEVLRLARMTQLRRDRARHEATRQDEMARILWYRAASRD